MKVLVTGGRDFKNRKLLFKTLDKLHGKFPFTVLIHGDARGADTLADSWACLRGVETDPCPADWNTFGKAAGGIRNSEMLTRQPDLVVAFPGGSGTFDMVSKAYAAGLDVISIAEPE